ncbi:hypothetical protein M0802_010306 [Mischocyttarus mexicanus]|nr:hypothetical protein M0802_010306 [Mischocyttarus mexicanus]
MPRRREVDVECGGGDGGGGGGGVALELGASQVAALIAPQRWYIVNSHSDGGFDGVGGGSSGGGGGVGDEGLLLRYPVEILRVQFL